MDKERKVEKRKIKKEKSAIFSPFGKDLVDFIWPKELKPKNVPSGLEARLICEMEADLRFHEQNKCQAAIFKADLRL